MEDQAQVTTNDNLNGDVEMSELDNMKAEVAAGAAKLVWDRVVGVTDNLDGGLEQVFGDVAALQTWAQQMAEGVNGALADLEARVGALEQGRPISDEDRQEAKDQYRMQVVAEAARLNVRPSEVKKMREALGDLES